MTGNLDNLDDLRELELPFEVDKVDSACHDCVRQQLKKYEKFVDSGGKAAGHKFQIVCQGIPSNYIDPALKASLTDDQYEDYLAVKDSVSFAKKYIALPNGEPWVARPYQALILRCTAKKKVLRLGRRSGKCLAKRSTILTNKGPLGIEEATKDKEIQLVTYNAKDSSFSLTNNYSIWSNGIKPVYKLTTRTGRENFITGNHPFLTMNKEGLLEWKETKDLVPKEAVLVPGSYEGLIKGKRIGRTVAKTLGYLIGDGGTTAEKYVSFTNIDLKIIKDFNNILFDFNCELKQMPSNKLHNYRITTYPEHRIGTKLNQVNRFVKDFDIKKLSKHKEVPKEVLASTEEDIANFLAAYWDCDGWCCVSKKKAVEVGICSASKKLILGTQHLLLRLGISSSFNYKGVKYKGGINDAWQLSLDSKEDIFKFAEKIPLVGKQENIKKVIRTIKNNNKSTSWKYLIPKEIHQYIEVERLKQNRSKRSIGFDKRTNTFLSIRSRYKPSKDKLRIIAENLKDKYLENLCSKKVQWVEIKSIEQIGEEETYDLTIPETHTLVSDDIISHNTDTIVTEILYSVFSTKNIKVFVAGPQKTHTEEIFNRLRERIHANPLLSNSIKKDISAPYYRLVLNNGSEVRGFAAGTKGKEGTVMRGQDADKIMCDEIDYIDPHALQGAIMPIMHTSADVTMLASSTPSGFETPYKVMCQEDPTYKEFHYNYKVLPWWKNIESDKVNYTNEEWEHEMLAEFGTSEAGVYKPSYIERALQQYQYSEMRYNPIWKYIIGADWNEKHGTEIVVLGYNPLTKKFQTVETQLIESAEFTQLKGVEALLKANREWKPAFVYVDVGNGSTNIELLKKTAMEHARLGGDPMTAKLLMTLRKYDAGANITTKDPITNEKIKKPAKSFMVNASVRLFEQGQIAISSHDHVLEKQLRSYIVERMTPTGNPVYGLDAPKVLDHRLDAFNLACVGFQLEFNDLHVVKHVSSAGLVLDPRIMNTNSKGRKEAIRSTPEPRAMETFKTPLEEQVFSNMPGRVDTLEGIKTNRKGWDIDQEELEKAKFLQRRQVRGHNYGYGTNRPARTNI